MALNTYANIKQAVKRWTHRDDIDEVMTDIIQLVESDIYKTGDVLLRVREMECIDSTVTSIGARELDFSCDYLDIRSIKVNGRKILLKTPENLSHVPQSGQPCAFTITDAIIFDRKCDAEYTVELDYYRRVHSLSDNCPTNIILQTYPNIYLYGCMAQANFFVGEEDKAAGYETKFFRAIKAANKASKRGRYGVSPSATLDVSVA